MKRRRESRAAALLKGSAPPRPASRSAPGPSPASRRSGRRADITLRQFGTGVSNLNAIAEKCKADLGITLEMTAIGSRRRRTARGDAAGQLRHRRHRVLDLQEGLSRAGVLQPMDVDEAQVLRQRSCRSSSPAS